jgi:hypothetical protein
MSNTFLVPIGNPAIHETAMDQPMTFSSFAGGPDNIEIAFSKVHKHSRRVRRLIGIRCRQRSVPEGLTEWLGIVVPIGCFWREVITFPVWQARESRIVGEHFVDVISSVTGGRLQLMPIASP